jgi:endonuclease G
VTSVDEVEKLTGLDFFSALPSDEQERLESKFDANEWAWRDARRGGR